MVPEELGMYALIDSCDQPKISNMFLGVHMNSLQHPCCLMIEGDYIIKIYQTCFFDVRHKLYTGMIGFGIFFSKRRSREVVRNNDQTTSSGTFEGNSLRWFSHIQYQFRDRQFYTVNIYIYIYIYIFV